MGGTPAPNTVNSSGRQIALGTENKILLSLGTEKEKKKKKGRGLKKQVAYNRDHPRICQEAEKLLEHSSGQRDWRKTWFMFPLHFKILDQSKVQTPKQAGLVVTELATSASPQSTSPNPPWSGCDTGKKLGLRRTKK